MVKRLRNGWLVRVVACLLVGVLLSIVIRGGGSSMQLIRYGRSILLVL